MFYDLKMSDAEKAKEKIQKVGFAFLLTYAVAAHISTALASAAMVGGVLSLIALVGICKGELDLLESQKKLLKVFSIFILLLLSTCPFSYNPQASFGAGIGMALRFTPMVMAIIFLRTSKQLQWIFGALFFSLAVADAVALNQLVNQQQTIGLVHNRIYFANQLLPMLILALPCMLYKDYAKKFRFSVGFIAIVTMGILLFSQVRGVWVASVVVLGVFFLGYQKRSKKLFALCCAVLVLATAILMVDPVLLERVKTISDAKNLANVERFYMWQSAWTMFIEEPLFGLGLGQFQHFYSSEYHYLLSVAREPNHAHPHNVVMTFLAETGAIGVSGFCGFFIYVLKELYGKYRTEHNAAAFIAFLAIVGFLAAGMTDNVFAMVTVLRLMALFIGVGFCNVIMKME